MDFKDINYILAIAKYQNISKAADSLYVTQPTLTKFLQKLENELGLKLFKKNGHKFILTYAGERYVEKGSKILLLKKELDAEMDDIVKLDMGVLNIAFPVMRGTYMLPCTLSVMKKKYPHVRINLKESNSSMLDAMILNGETDLAFFSLAVKNPLIDYDVIAKEEMVLVMQQDHPLSRFTQDNPYSQYPRLDLNLLHDEIVIVQITKQRTRQVMDEVFKEEGIEYKNRLVTSNIQASVILASQGYGVAFVCATHLRHMKLDHPVQCFSFGKTRTTVDFVAAYRKGAYLPVYAQDYIQIVRQFT